MNFGKFVMIMVVTSLAANTRAQDLPASEAETSQVATFSTSRFKFVSTKETLKMMEQALAANESILAKQKETFSQIAELQSRAQAAKSAAAKSLSRHK